MPTTPSIAIYVLCSLWMTPGRTLVLSVTLSGAIVFWAYNAGLVSLLTIDNIVFPIKKMEDLAEKSQYMLLIQSGMFDFSLFKFQFTIYNRISLLRLSGTLFFGSRNPLIMSVYSKLMSYSYN